ncbi:transposase [Yersinia enterocolitica]|nr:transposase [Yersinia enterocolitica]
MKVSTLGIDLAKNVFQLHGVGCNGQTVLKKKLTRDKFLPFLMQLEPCLIGMEACASSHHFARVLRLRKLLRLTVFQTKGFDHANAGEAFLRLIIQS